MARGFTDVRQGLKYIITVREKDFKTESVIDVISGETMKQEFLEECGIEKFDNASDMKRTLCMELEGDPDRYKTMTDKERKIIAFIFD